MTGWRKSSYSIANGNCVYTRWCGDHKAIEIRDDPGSRTLEFTPAEWAAFVAGVKAGEFDDLLPEDGAT